MEQAVKVVVKGRVQGVGFRWFTREKARDLGLAGYVRNLSDGNVEVCAEGGQQEINELISMLRQGPSWSQVTDLEIDDAPVLGKYEDFNVR